MYYLLIVGVALLIAHLTRRTSTLSTAVLATLGLLALYASIRAPELAPTLLVMAVVTLIARAVLRNRQVG